MDTAMPTTPAPVQPVVPAQPVMQTQPLETTPVQPSSTTKNPMMIVGIVVAAVIFLTLGVFALAAANVGKGNVFSQLAAVLPVEKIPGISSLGKSGEQLLRDAVPANVGSQLHQKYGGSEWESSARVYANGETADQQKVGLDLHLNGTSAVNAKGDQMQAKASLGGEMNMGVVKVDLGESGVTYDLLMPNANQIFFSVDLSDELKDMVRPYFDQMSQATANSTMAQDMPFKSMDDVFGVYWKLDLQEYMDMMSSMTGQPAMKYDFEKSQAAGQKLMLAIGPDLKKVYDASLGDVSRYATVQDLGRESVHGKQARVVGLDVNNTNMAPVFVEFVDGGLKVMRDHKDAFKQFCEDMSATEDEKTQCSDTYSDENIAEMKLEDADKADVERGMREALKMVKFTTMKFSISPVDNTLLKYEVTLDASPEALSIFAQEGVTVSKAGMTLTGAEVSRGKDLVVKAPETYKNMLDFIKSMMAAETQMLGVGEHMEDSTAPTFPVPVGSSMTPEQQQQLLQSAEYQKMMQQYYGTTPSY